MTYDNLLKRFLTYVKINTRSDANSTKTPTTQGQVDFALTILKPEMESIGLKNVHYLPNGYLVGTLPANGDFPYKIGFLAHMDTADFNAEGVNPQVIEHYDGSSIQLGQTDFALDPADFPNLKNYIGVGSPIKDILEPSVPPRIGSITGSIAKSSITFLAIVTQVISFSITFRIL